MQAQAVELVDPAREVADRSDRSAARSLEVGDSRRPQGYGIDVDVLHVDLLCDCGPAVVDVLACGRPVAKRFDLVAKLCDRHRVLPTHLGYIVESCRYVLQRGSDLLGPEALDRRVQVRAGRQLSERPGSFPHRLEAARYELAGRVDQCEHQALAPGRAIGRIDTFILHGDLRRVGGLGIVRHGAMIPKVSQGS